MDKFSTRMLFIFLTSLGVVIGGTLLGSLAAIIGKDRPVEVMQKLASDLKFWAIIAAIGGSFGPIRALETGIFDGQVKIIIKQLLFIISAFVGAQVGYYIITTLSGGNR